MSDASKQSITIKKYANRRLYNTATSSYVTLEDLSKMVKEGIEFNVYDAKTSEDLTRSVLTQIIVEEEGKVGQNLLPVGFLRQLIGFYGDNMQWLVPKYLEHSMQSLSRNQEQLRTYFKTAFGATPFGSMFPFGTTLEEMGKQNMAMFERAMRMFAPFGNATGVESGGEGVSETVGGEPTASETPVTPSVSVPSFQATNVTPMPTPATSQATAQAGSSGGEDVQGKIAALQRQLAELAKNKA